MTGTPENLPASNTQPVLSEAEVEELLRSLRRKEGTWVEWGQACQQLQKAGYNPQVIFEDTGFEPIQQNQIVVASQVYASMIAAGVPEGVRSHFEQRGSDILYEFRILTQPDRAAAATFVVEKSVDSEGAHELAKALKEFSRLSKPPEGFINHPGDALAYQHWKAARQQPDLQVRSRLIAQGLRFAQSATAREKIERLLTDFTVVKTRPTPRLPVYRLESEEELPRALPVVGKLPLTIEDLKAVPLVDEEGPFRIVKFSQGGAWVAVPGWQMVLRAEDPIVIISDSEQLPEPLPGKAEEVLVIVDRAQRQWDADSYFIVEQSRQLQIQWFEELTETPLLGKVIIIMRPKRVLDEEFTKELWHIDE